MSDLVTMLGLPFLACMLMGSILSYLGIHVLKREVIFIDIAVAQVAAVGYTQRAPSTSMHTPLTIAASSLAR